MTFKENAALFLEETQDILARLGTVLVELEQIPGDIDLINEAFRALHTIKGSAGMFGFENVSGFTHSVENLFSEIRTGKVSVDTDIINIGLRSIDCIASLLENGDGGADRKQILIDVETILQKTTTEDPSSTSVDSGKEQKPSPITVEVRKEDGLLNAWKIDFKPQRDILHRGVRLEPLFRELQGMGSCHFVALSESVPDLLKLDPTALYLSWVITLSTNQNLAAIKSVFMFVEDYSELSIIPIELQNSAGEEVVPKLGELLVSHGLIDAGEAETISRDQKLFGQSAVASGKIRPDQIKVALAEQATIKATISERETSHESATVRVRKEKLDFLVDLVGELVILQANLESEAKTKAIGVFESISENLAHLAANLRDNIMGIRMVPLAESFTSFQRLVRDLSHSLGKELKLEISGGSIELDKNIIELLKDPLVHIIRNSADHGVELPSIREAAGKPRTGTIVVEAHQVGSRVEITIADDGAGLDTGKIRTRAIERKLLSPTETDANRIMSMIFEPGFSTAEKTTNLSGRGVGMDVVKRNIERLRGEVSLHSEFGKGMTVTLSIPLTLVIIEGLLVRIATHVYVITLSQVEECVDLVEADRNARSELINVRGKTIPVISLRKSLGILEAYDGISRIIIVHSEDSMIGLAVDAVVGKKQVVIKPLSSTIRHIKAISGATILGDGSVALILDVAEIIKSQPVD